MRIYIYIQLPKATPPPGLECLIEHSGLMGLWAFGLWAHGLMSPPHPLVCPGCELPRPGEGTHQ